MCWRTMRRNAEKEPKIIIILAHYSPLWFYLMRAYILFLFVHNFSSFIRITIFSLSNRNHWQYRGNVASPSWLQWEIAIRRMAVGVSEHPPCFPLGMQPIASTSVKNMSKSVKEYVSKCAKYEPRATLYFTLFIYIRIVYDWRELVRPLCRPPGWYLISLRAFIDYCP